MSLGVTPPGVVGGRASRTSRSPSQRPCSPRPASPRASRAPSAGPSSPRARNARSLGTSVAQVNVADVVAKTAIPSVEAVLNGRTPGVVVLPGTGQIGAGANIRIRGMGTLSLSSQPLVYVDGVRVNNSTGSGLEV